MNQKESLKWCGWCLFYFSAKKILQHLPVYFHLSSKTSERFGNQKTPYSWKEILLPRASIFRVSMFVFGSVFWWFFCLPNEAWLLAGFTTPSVECHWWLLRGSLQVARIRIFTVVHGHVVVISNLLWPTCGDGRFFQMSFPQRNNCSAVFVLRLVTL